MVRTADNENREQEERLSRRAFAKRIGVTEGAVRKAIKEGKIEVGDDGLIEPIEAERQWVENSDPARSPVVRTHQAESTRTMSFNDARAAKETYLAKLRELEFKQKSGDLVSTRSVQESWFAILRLTRSRMLNIPDRIADMLATEVDPAVVHTTLMAEINQALTTLADEVENLGDA